jgi:MFS family permease
MNMQTWLRSDRPVPAAYRSNFRHLYMDIAWYGVLAASAVSFLAVYAARLGASGFQLGLLSAGPAVVSLFVTLPAGHWLGRIPIGRSVFWSAASFRFFYLLWIPLPLLLAPAGQVWALIAMVFLMGVPGTALAIGFNALFAGAVPPEWRNYVAGRRNALLSITFIVVSLLCGELLDRLPFPTNYQIVFGLGVLGGAMSTFHLWFIVSDPDDQPRPLTGRSIGDLARPGVPLTLVDSRRSRVGLRWLTRRRRPNLLRPDVLRGPYARLMLIVAGFHLALYLAIPLFPLHLVNNLHLSDQQIGLGAAVFYVSVFVGSTQLANLGNRVGNQRVTAIGAILMSSYPAFLAFSRGLGLVLVGSAAGGLGWALMGGALANYLLEKIPDGDRPAHLAWYNLALNAALLLGSLTGPWVADLIGIPAALELSAVLRLVFALVILWWE